MEGPNIRIMGEYGDSSLNPWQVILQTSYPAVKLHYAKENSQLKSKMTLKVKANQAHFQKQPYLS